MGKDTPGCVACHTSAAGIFNFNDNSLATSCLTMNDDVEDDFAKVNGQETLGRKEGGAMSDDRWVGVWMGGEGVALGPGVSCQTQR